MISTEAYQELKERILSKRKLMKGVRSDSHWVQLHADLRTVLGDAFVRLRVDQVATIIGFPVECIERWRGEAVALAELAQRVELVRRNGRLSNSLSIHIRADVCGLATIAGVRTVCRALGLARATVLNWQKHGWDQTTLPGEDRSLPGIDATPAEPEALDSGIAQDAEAKQLQQFLERHRGKVRRKYSLTEKKLMLALCERFGSKAVHDLFGVSYDTIARLKRRQEDEVERKARTPMRYIPVIDLMKKHPGMGPMQIRDYIRRHLGLSMGVASIRKIMEQQGWVPPFVKTTRVNDGMQLYEAARKNYLWHMDFKHQYVNRCKVFILFIQDDYSRFIVGHSTCDGEKVDLVLTAVEEAIRVHGKPESVMNDGGSAFFAWRGSSRFTRFLEDYGIEQLIAQTPNVNGKLENLNQQVEKEVLLVTDFASVDHFQRELAKWVGHYNFSRPHQGLGERQVPADRYFPGAGTWYGKNSDMIRQQSLIAETMATLLGELKKSS